MEKDTHKDQLEEFILAHQQEFDDKMPSEKIWVRIKSSISRRKERSVIYWQAAAMIFFILSLGLLVNNYMGSPKPLATRVENAGFMATESFYSKKILDKQQFIMATLSSRPVIEEDFKEDWRTLEENYKQLKQEYLKNGGDQLLNALIINLQTQVKLLNRQLNIINQIKNDEHINS